MTVDRDRVTDDRLVFYLERRELIDEWAKLNELEKVAAHQFLLDLGSEIAHRVAQHDPAVRSEFLVLDTAEQFHVLYRPEWLSAPPVEPLLPRAVICKRSAAVGARAVADEVFAPWLAGRHDADVRRIAAVLGVVAHEAGAVAAGDIAAADGGDRSLERAPFGHRFS